MYACSNRGTGKWLATDGTLNLDVFCVQDKDDNSVEKINKTKISLSMERTNSSDSAISKISEAQSAAINNFVNRTLERLVNFNKILDIKIQKMEISVLELIINKRILFFLPDDSNIEVYIEQKLKDKKKQDKLKKAKLLIKMITSLVMSVSFLLIANTIRRILNINIKGFDLAKIRKEKAKRKKNTKNKTVD